ncbi:hypothetical protein QVD17_06519 [Tagetes erecta]|uniref:Uncharacterized protein n=1 Tax=Tagetes erecta TaxID=13708 RepID=A0AAD8LDU8_TARER|nr:hypothetical protein QVD17_06519 [Tagetes erecta]
MNHLAISILFITTLLFTSSIVTVHSTTTASLAPSPTLDTLGCDSKCGKRCANAGYKERCMTYCGICCDKCYGCVPSSPYADKAECPCYRDLKNSKGKAKHCHLGSHCFSFSPFCLRRLCFLHWWLILFLCVRGGFVCLALGCVVGEILFEWGNGENLSIKGLIYQRRLEVSGFECSSNLMDRYLFKHKELIRDPQHQCNGPEIEEDLADFLCLRQAIGKHGITCVEDLIHEILTTGSHFKEGNNFHVYLIFLELRCFIY